MKTVKTYLTILLLLCFGTMAHAATADQLMQNIADKFAQAGSVSAKFKVTSGKRSVQGKLQVQGKAYTMSADRVNVWFDGTTQWVYNPAEQEITISQPTVNEQIESNPFMLVKEYKNRYKLSKSGQNTVVLTPKKGGIGIASARITFGADGMPTRLSAVFDNGTSFSADITRLTFGSKLPDATFKLNPTTYPRAEVIDLR